MPLFDAKHFQDAVRVLRGVGLITARAAADRYAITGVVLAVLYVFCMSVWFDGNIHHKYDRLNRFYGD